MKHTTQHTPKMHTGKQGWFAPIFETILWLALFFTLISRTGCTHEISGLQVTAHPIFDLLGWLAKEIPLLEKIDPLETGHHYCSKTFLALFNFGLI